jgi:hypothetical protein
LSVNSFHRSECWLGLNILRLLSLALTMDRHGPGAVQPCHLNLALVLANAGFRTTLPSTMSRGRIRSVEANLAVRRRDPQQAIGAPIVRDASILFLGRDWCHRTILSFVIDAASMAPPP